MGWWVSQLSDDSLPALGVLGSAPGSTCKCFWRDGRTFSSYSASLSLFPSVPVHTTPIFSPLLFWRLLLTQISPLLASIFLPQSSSTPTMAPIPPCSVTKNSQSPSTHLSNIFPHLQLPPNLAPLSYPIPYPTTLQCGLLPFFSSLLPGPNSEKTESTGEEISPLAVF